MPFCLGLQTLPHREYPTAKALTTLCFLILNLRHPENKSIPQNIKGAPPSPHSSISSQCPAVPVAHAAKNPTFLQRVCGCLAVGLTHIRPRHETEKQKTKERIRKPTGDLFFFYPSSFLLFPFMTKEAQGGPYESPPHAQYQHSRTKSVHPEYLQDTVRDAGIRYGLIRCITGIDDPQTQTRSSFACLRCKFTVAVS